MSGTTALLEDGRAVTLSMLGQCRGLTCMRVGPWPWALLVYRQGRGIASMLVKAVAILPSGQDINFSCA